jgi:N-acylneuraminate cytidylyltransferase
MPEKTYRCLPKKIDLIVLDFDGVFTDNRVWVNADGEEWVAANRGDGWGIARLKDAGYEIVVLSTETHPVVSARCKKLGLETVQGSSDKLASLQQIVHKRGFNPEQVIYLGNDVNDVPCFDFVGCAIVVADAHPDAKIEADMVLVQAGGYGAIRELCDMILETQRGG